MHNCIANLRNDMLMKMYFLLPVHREGRGGDQEGVVELLPERVEVAARVLYLGRPQRRR